MVFGLTHYRDVLKEALSQRCASNPLYSLRAFARDLKISPSQLSLILGGKKGLSAVRAKAAAKALGFDERESQYFCTLVDSAHARSKAAKIAAKSRLVQLTVPQDGMQLQLDAFRAVSDWYHFAILQLMKLTAWREDPKWIAAQLQINATEAERSLERLERLELIEKKNGRYAVCEDSVFAPDGIPSDAVKKFHKQILEKATTALIHQDLDRRYFNTTLLPVDSADLPRARKRIKDFHQKFTNEFSRKQKLNRVYCLAVQLFDLTNDDSGGLQK